MMNLRSEKLLNLLSKMVFIIYICLIIWVVMFKCNLMDSIYKAYAFVSEQTLLERFTRFIIPFKDYTEDFFSNQIHILIKDDILNFLIFIPLGLYLAFFINDKKLIKTLLITFITSLFFELFQLFSLIGSFATKDFITNLLGSFIGFMGYKLIYKKENSEIKLIILNIISIMVIIVFSPIVIYAFINTIKHFNVYVDVILRRLV